MKASLMHLRVKQNSIFVINHKPDEWWKYSSILCVSVYCTGKSISLGSIGGNQFECIIFFLKINPFENKLSSIQTTTSIHWHIFYALIYCVRIVLMSKHFGNEWAIRIEFLVSVAVVLAGQNERWHLIFGAWWTGTFIWRRSHHARRSNQIWNSCCLPNGLLRTVDSSRNTCGCRSSNSLP